MQKLHFSQNVLELSLLYYFLTKSMQSTTINTTCLHRIKLVQSLIQNYNLDIVRTFSLKKIYSRLDL